MIRLFHLFTGGGGEHTVLKGPIQCKNIYCILVLSPMHYLDPKKSLVLKSSGNSENSQLIQTCDLDF